ncbi:MAG: DNA translocase FtsK [Subdoligranulum sp.]
MSRLEQRRAQQQNLIRSVVLAGLGILAIALVLVPGQSFWNVLRSWLFGTFGVVTHFVGPFLLYLAYLLASGYHVGTFIGKVLLLAVLLAGTAVIFSDFKVGDTPWQTVKMLFAWGQRKFWTGGVLGVPIGASLLAVCGRPGANIVMIIVILMGLMVFFAVTPVDVVQFISYYIQEFKARRAARAEEETAYDTQLFGHEAEEESLENLTGSLPPMAGESPATPQSGTRRPFDVAPYLEQEEAARRNAAQANPADQAAAAAQAGQPAAQPQQAYTQPGTATYPDMQRAQAAPQGVQHTQSFALPAQRSDFDVDLGPDASQRALQNAVQHDPLQKIDIGPGGTFGLDPLEQLNHREYPAPQPEPQPQPQEESFELHLEPEAQQAEEAPVEEDSLNDLIQRAVTGRDTPVAGADVGLPDEDEAGSFETPLTPEPEDNAPAASVEDFATPLEPVEELPEPDDVGSSESADNFETPLVPEPTQPAPAPVTAIPTLGGSFDQGGFDAAKAAWNAGIPVSDLLTGRVSVQAPAPQPTAQPAAAAPKVYSVTDERRPGSPNRLRVSSSMGNSASAPISSPPSVAKAMAKAPAAPAATAPAGAAREADEDASSEATAAFAAQAKEEFPPYTYPSLNLFNAAKPEDERGAAAEMKKNADILVNTLDSFGVKTHILDICRGPSVTRYELQPQAGIKVSRITSLSDDIALNLATAGVRIEAPIPGKPRRRYRGAQQDPVYRQHPRGV